MVTFPLFNHPGLQALMLGVRIAEPILVMIAGVVAFILRHGFTWPSSDYELTILGAGAVYAVVAALMGCYRQLNLRHAWQAIPRLALALFATLLLVVAVLFLLKTSEEFSRFWLAIWLVTGVVHLLGLRLWAEHFLRRASKRGKWQRHVAIYGMSGKTMPVLDELHGLGKIGLVLVGVYENDESKVSADMRASGLYRGGLAQLQADSLNGRIDDIIVAIDITQHPQATALLDQFHAMPSNVFYCLPLPFFGRVQQDILISGVPLVQVYHKPPEGQSVWMKRALDVTVSGLALVAISPLMLTIAMLVKLSSPGPVFFRQQRGGFNGQTFEMLKFRSMRVGAAAVKDESGKEKQATQDDPRITPIGKFIRKTSIDELPQLINVLRGDMSLVGPRPHAMSHDTYYANMVDRYASRQKMRPGLTGWAQLNGWRGETDTIEKMAKRVEYDIWYIENYSLALDLKILFLTPFIVFRQKTAY